MPKMMKKASVLTASGGPARIVSLARALSEPVDFYEGRRYVDQLLPDNILLFHRKHASDLNSSTDTKAFHQRHVLIVPLQGSGQVIANARAIPLSAGRCVLIAPFQFHHYVAISRPEIDWLFITFTYGNQPLVNTASGEFLVRGPFWTDLAELILSFQDRADLKNPARVAWRLALLLDCLSAVSAPQPRHTATVAKEELLLKISTVASAHLREPLSVPQLAKQLGFSSSHLRQKFHQLAGISIGRFLREYRLRHAAELLVTGRANVSEASEACGWDTPYAFSRAFRSYWGRAPKAFALAKRN